MAKQKKLTFEQVPAAVAQILERMDRIEKLLEAQPAPAKNGKASGKSAVAPGEIGIDKVCVILKRAKPTVYALVKSGKLKARKQGNALLFNKEEVEAYAASSNSTKSTRGRKKAKPAVKAKAATKVAPKVRANAKSKVSPKPDAKAVSPKSGDRKPRYPKSPKGGRKGGPRTQKPQKPETTASTSASEPQSSQGEEKA